MFSASETVQLAHGEGGRAMRRLIEELIAARLYTPPRAPRDDAAKLPAVAGRLAMTTDSFVVSPLFFPGGDIGKLAVIGTVNDLAVMGAQPRWLSCSLILEEGLPLELLDRVLTSASQAAVEAGVEFVTGDTKVVPRGAADKLFINTTGVGEFLHAPWPGGASLSPGDRLLVTGPMGRHGAAVMAAREQLGFDPAPVSDCASLAPAARALQEAGARVLGLRDATRGGVAAVLHEWAEECGHSLEIEERRLPVSADVRGVCELLGLEPVHLANEGTMVAAAPEADVDRVLAALRSVDVAAQACEIGRVVPKGLAPVTIVRGLGRAQPLDQPFGALLPRIC